MFDIGFTELLVVAVVALLVIGPEQLPETIRTASVWIGRLRRNFNALKQDIEREIGADDIKRQIHNEGILKELEDARQEVNSIANKLTDDAQSLLSEPTEDIDQTQSEEAMISGKKQP